MVQICLRLGAAVCATWTNMGSFSYMGLSTGCIYIYIYVVFSLLGCFLLRVEELMVAHNHCFMKPRVNFLVDAESYRLHVNIIGKRSIKRYDNDLRGETSLREPRYRSTGFKWNRLPLRSLHGCSHFRTSGS